MTMTQKELNEILEKHEKWLNNEEGGERANLRSADLYGANLYGANLRSANLYGANLYCANLCDANLYGANLRSANLCDANLYGANLRSANLYGANLYGANLRSAKIEDKIKIQCFPLACPEVGSFIGYKKCGNYIVMLSIPVDAKRSSAYGRKCRCSKANVLAIENMDGTPATITRVPSGRDKNFIYTVGDTMSVSDFDENRWNECSTGIHFFITRQEAVDYNG